MEGSMSMDQILSRFSNFSTERSKKEASSHDDDDNEEEEDEDKKDEEHKKEDMVEEPNEDKLSFLRERDEEYKKEQEETDVNTASKTTIISVDIKEEPLAQEFIDSNYWNLNYLSTEKSLDELIAEMELWINHNWCETCRPPQLQTVSCSKLIARSQQAPQIIESLFLSYLLACRSCWLGMQAVT